MAQNQFINVTVDPAAARKPDITDHRHIVTLGNAPSGDATLAYDSSKIVNGSILKSVALAAMNYFSSESPTTGVGPTYFILGF